jgi:transglutaminase-like putative cysteine protease
MTANVHAIPTHADAPPADTPAARLARGGGWWTLFLALIMLLAMTEALNAAAWSDGLDAVRLAVLGGALLGFLLSLTRWDGFFPAAYSFLASLFWITTLFNTFIFKSLTAQEGVQELARRNGEWLYALVSGKASADNLIFITQLAFLGWWIGYLAIWSLMRHQNVVYAIVPAGLALLINVYFAPTNLSGFVILYLAAVLLLAIRVELARNQTRWQLARVRYAPDIALDFLKSGVLFTVVVIALAWTVPNVASTLTADQLLRPFEDPWHSVQDTWRRMYRALNYGPAVTQVTAFGKTASFGGPVALTDRPIFEAETPERTYWRAAAFDTYTSQGWLNTDSESVPLERFQSLGEPRFAATREMTTTIRTLETGQEVVFGPPTPVRVSVPVNADATLIPGAEDTRSVSLLRSRVNLNRERSYQVVSTTSTASPDLLRSDRTDYPQWVADRYLQLPDTVPARVKDLAARIAMAYDNPYDKAGAIEAALRTYTYDQGIAAPPAGADGVDYFLYDIKRGYCDYYASAMVVMLRSVGVPARFVVGYTPGQAVPQQEQTEDGLTQYRVLERNAHAWPEVYFPTYGWIQFEPTASEPVLARPAPEQEQALESGLKPDTPDIDADDLPPDMGQPEGTASLQEAGGLGSWVKRNWGWLLLLVGLIAAAAGAWAVMHRRQAALFKDTEAIGQLFGMLGVWAARLRIPWPSSHTPREHAAEFDRKLPEAAAAVDHIASLFVAQRYGRQRPSSEMLAEVVRNWRALQPRLWRSWLAELAGTPERKPGKDK